MTIPNVGVTSVIQNPGLGGSIAQGLGGIAQMLMQQQALKDKRLKDAADIAYQNELTTTSRTAREAAAEAARQQQRQLEEMERRSQEAMEFLQASGGLTGGQVAGLMQLDPATRRTKLSEMLGLTTETLGADQRIVSRTPTGGYTTLVGAAPETPKAADNSTDFRNFLGFTINPETGRPYDPNTRPSQLSKETALEWREYLKDTERLRAPKGNSTIIEANDKFASGFGAGLSEDILKTKVMARDAAKDLNTVNELRALLDDGVIAGAGADVILKAGEVLAQLGIGGRGTKDAVARTQQYAALVGQRVGQVITMFGSGTGLSDADREYATQIAGGQIKMTDDALRWLLDKAEQADRYLIDTHNATVSDIPDDVVPSWQKQSYTVKAPAPRAPAGLSGKTYQYKGKSYPIIKGSDGNNYISTPEGQFKVGG